MLLKIFLRFFSHVYEIFSSDLPLEINYANSNLVQIKKAVANLQCMKIVKDEH